MLGPSCPTTLPADAAPAAPRPSNVRWVVLGIVAFAPASAYLTRHCISAANTTIQRDLGFNNEQMGLILSAFSLGYLFCQIPGGWLGQRFGTRFAFAFLSTLWSLCSVWTAAAFTFRLMWTSRFALGLFQAGLSPISAKILKDWIPVRNRGISSAAIGAAMSIGGAFTMWFTGWLLSHDYSWRAVFSAYSLVGIIWAVGFYRFFRTSPEEHGAVNEAELRRIRDPDYSPASRTTTADQPATETTDREITIRQVELSLTGYALFLSMLKSRSLWGLCVQSFFRAAGYAFFVTWFFAFLEYVYGTSRAEAGLFNSLPLLATVVGTTSGGVIVDLLLQKTGSKGISRRATAGVALAACGLFTMASAWTSSASGLAIVIAIGAVFSGIGGPAAWAATIDIAGQHTALFVGTQNMAGCVAAVLLPTVLGNWFDRLQETGGDWNLVIYLHAAFYLAGALAWLLVNPNDSPTEPKTTEAESLPTR